MSARERLAEVEHQIGELHDQLRELQKEERELSLELCPWKVGQLVEWLDQGYGANRRQLVRGVICQVDVRFSVDRPYLMANPIRKDGTVGTARRHVGSNATLVEP